MEILNPRRILILSPPDTPINSLLNALTTTTSTPLPTSSTSTTTTTTTTSPPLPTLPTSSSLLHPPSTTPSPSRSLSLSQDLTHQITTPYYRALIPIWLDTLSPLLLPTWTTSWLSPSAAEVIRAIGAFVVVVRKPGTGEEVEGLKKLLRGVDGVVEKGGGGWDGVRVVVGFAGGMVGVARGEVVEGLKEGVGGGDEVKEGVGEWGGGKEEGVEIRIRVKEEVMGEEMGVELENQRGMGVEMGKEIGEEEWERICWEEGGWEWVDGEVVGGERTGEHRELTGLARLKEALETNDWEGDDGDELVFEGLDIGEDDGDGEAGFKAEAAEVEREMFEMRRAIYESREGQGEEEEVGTEEQEDEEGGDIQVEELESMMLKMQAIRDMGADLPESERKNFAAKAVREIMKTI